MNGSRHRSARSIALLPVLILATALACGPRRAEASLSLRVLLLGAAAVANVAAEGTWRIYSLAEERLLHQGEGGGTLRLSARGGRIEIRGSDRMTLPPGGARFRALGGHVRLNGVPYRGTLDAVASGGRLWVVNNVRLEDYLRGVVGREIPAGWPVAALRAQAVAARTFLLLVRAQAERSGNGLPLYHITAGTGDQVYGGIPAEDPAIDDAVSDTRGQVLTYAGTVARAFFHAASGGHTEGVRWVWPALDGAYLRGVPVSPEQRDATQAWDAWIPLNEVRRALVREGRRIGSIRDVRVDTRTPSGRADKVRVVHDGGDLSLPGTWFRRALGHTRVRSTLFHVRRQGEYLSFQGRGFGHGVGMSQQGARLLAERGLDYRRILAHFYPGTVLSRAEKAAFPDDLFLVPQDIDDLNTLLGPKRP